MIVRLNDMLDKMLNGYRKGLATLYKRVIDRMWAGTKQKYVPAPG